VLTKKYFKKLLRKKSFIQKIKIVMSYLHLKNLKVPINLIFQIKLILLIYQLVKFQDLKMKIKHKKIQTLKLKLIKKI